MDTLNQAVAKVVRDGGERSVSELLKASSTIPTSAGETVKPDNYVVGVGAPLKPIYLFAAGLQAPIVVSPTQLPVLIQPGYLPMAKQDYKKRIVVEDLYYYYVATTNGSLNGEDIYLYLGYEDKMGLMWYLLAHKRVYGSPAQPTVANLESTPIYNAQLSSYSREILEGNGRLVKLGKLIFDLI